MRYPETEQPPEGHLTANVGCIIKYYLVPGLKYQLYVKKSGYGNVGWEPLGGPVGRVFISEKDSGGAYHWKEVMS